MYTNSLKNLAQISFVIKLVILKTPSDVASINVMLYKRILLTLNFNFTKIKVIRRYSHKETCIMALLFLRVFNDFN
jgi:hypothetical protein